MSRNDDTYTIRFQGTLSDTPVRQLVATSFSTKPLKKAVEQLGGGIVTSVGSASVTVSTRADISSTPTLANQVQVLAVQATGGSYRLSFHVNGVAFQTDPIPYNVGAAELRQIIQRAIAAGETNDPFLRAYLQFKLDVWVDRYPNGYLSQNIYLLHFQGELRRENLGPGVDTLTVDTSGLAAGGTASITTRMDGVQYYGFETVNVDTGSRRRRLRRPGDDEGEQRLHRRRRDERHAERRRRPRVLSVERRSRPRLVETASTS